MCLGWLLVLPGRKPSMRWEPWKKQAGQNGLILMDNCPERNYSSEWWFEVKSTILVQSKTRFEASSVWGHRAIVKHLLLGKQNVQKAWKTYWLRAECKNCKLPPTQAIRPLSAFSVIMWDGGSQQLFSSHGWAGDLLNTCPLHEACLMSLMRSVRCTHLASDQKRYCSGRDVPLWWLEIDIWLQPS